MFGQSLFDECLDLVRKWKPRNEYPNELKYRDDLMDFLHINLNQSNNLFSGRRNVKIKKEASRSLCDVGIGNSQVGIELKKDLKTKSQINRLQGQIEDYEDDYNEGVIVVLVGKIDKFVENDLLHKLNKRLNNSMGFGVQQFRIKLVNKSTTKNKESPKRNNNPFGIDLGFGGFN
jgi:hypothetical protein